MGKVLGFLRSEPALVAAVVLAVVQAVAVPEAWQKVILAVLSLVAGGAVRSQVTPTVKATAPPANADVEVNIPPVVPPTDVIPPAG